MIPINHIFNILVILPQITQYYDIWLKSVIRPLRLNGKHAVRFNDFMLSWINLVFLS